MTDMILHLNYTAREGGEVLRRAANEIAQRHLPGAGIRYFDVQTRVLGCMAPLPGQL